MINWRIWHTIFALGFLIANSVTMYITFLYAYFFGDKIFAFTINSLGEADIELIFLTIGMAISALWICTYFGRVRK